MTADLEKTEGAHLSESGGEWPYRTDGKDAATQKVNFAQDGNVFPQWQLAQASFTA
jgi:hypothetical protein